MSNKTTRRTKTAVEPKVETPAPAESEISVMSPEAAAEMIRELQARLAEATKPEPAPAPVQASPEQVEQIRSLQAALLDSRRKESAARNLATQANDAEVFEVKSLTGASVSIEVTDSKGHLKRVIFEQKGAVQFLTAAQVAEVQERTRFFERGYLQAPEIVALSPNAIEDYDALLDSLGADEIRTRLAEIDSPEVLFGLYHHIEGMRFIEKGNEVEQVELPGKAQIALYTVMDRLRALTGISLSANEAD